jgi:hypothetical protein
MRQTLYFIILATLLSCNQSDNSKSSYRDTVLGNYFTLVDSSGKFDTSDMNFKALKAYYQNDTSYLTELDRYIKQQKTGRNNWDLWQTDIPLPKLNQLNVDAAFRFIFSVYDAPTYEAITVTQNDTSYKLNYLCYYRDRGSSQFDKRKEFEKSISKNDWQEIVSKLLYADYWGLKNQKDFRGDDGNDLTVIGYQKFDNTERSHFVHRWANTTLNDAFYFVYYKLLNKNERLFTTN